MPIWPAVGLGLGALGSLVGFFAGGESGREAAQRLLLSRMAAGRGPSAASAMAQTMQSRALADQLALAAAFGGSSPLAALRSAQLAGLGMQREIAAGVLPARAQEQMEAIQQLGAARQRAADLERNRWLALGTGISALGQGLNTMFGPQGSAR